jgi:hypothetical protein
MDTTGTIEMKQNGMKMTYGVKDKTSDMRDMKQHFTFLSCSDES